ncbi:uncharacterized protein N7482_006916 [Penicillium canariense]|uniref:Thioredoxin n=1 Tax=Penicillium canariense TaxID=189055 RepID=A0A9W9HYN1_9EURO|nr:uncharacterized protein N7482_006916 [Penicillium canariense]KAJ5159912.1 hypothetical protein N7482_006916 [Penicillium canariense]
MGVTQIKTVEEFNTLVKDTKEPVIVDYFATWCGPCKAISPLIEKLSEQHTGIKFYKIDVDELNELAAENGISAMPTFQFYKGGEVINTVQGADQRRIMEAVATIAA